MAMFENHKLFDKAAGAYSGRFKPIRTIQPNPLFRERPSRREPYVQFYDSDGFVCFVSLCSIADMADWGRQAGENEVIGRLGGRICADSRGTYVLVQEATLNCKARSGAAFIEADSDAQEAARSDFERKCRPLDCMGWWHTHPGSLGLFYSPTDRQNQATWSDSNAIGIVLNPELRGDVLKVFRGPRSLELNTHIDPETIRIALAGRSATPTSGKQSAVIKTIPAPSQTEHLLLEMINRQNAWRTRNSVGVATTICIALAALFIATITHVLVWTSVQKLSAKVETVRADRQVAGSNPLDLNVAGNREATDALRPREDSQSVQPSQELLDLRIESSLQPSVPKNGIAIEQTTTGRHHMGPRFRDRLPWSDAFEWLTAAAAAADPDDQLGAAQPRDLLDESEPQQPANSQSPDIQPSARHVEKSP